MEEAEIKDENIYFPGNDTRVLDIKARLVNLKNQVDALCAALKSGDIDAGIRKLGETKIRSVFLTEQGWVRYLGIIKRDVRYEFNHIDDVSIHYLRFIISLELDDISIAFPHGITTSMLTHDELCTLECKLVCIFSEPFVPLMEQEFTCIFGHPYAEIAISVLRDIVQDYFVTMRNYLFIPVSKNVGVFFTCREAQFVNLKKN